MKVFLSYAERDHKAAEYVAARLEKAGLDTWLDSRDVLPGDNAALKAGKALETAQAIVFIVSPESAKSSRVRNDISFALVDSRFHNRVFPVIARATQDTPWFFRRLKSFKIRTDLAKLIKIIRQLGERNHTTRKVSNN